MLDHSTSALAYTVGQHDHRLQTLEEKVGKMKGDLETLRAWSQRVAILLALWTAGASAHLTSDQLSDVLAKLVKAVLIK